MSIQSELWNLLTDHDFEIYKTTKPQRFTEAEEKRDRLEQQFLDTLTESQKQAFYALSNINSGINCDIECQGITIGVMLARELYKLLDCPEKAFKESVERYLDFEKAERTNIETLNDYFEAFRISNKVRTGGKQP